MHVVNYDLPDSNYGGIDEYIHRIGKLLAREVMRRHLTT
jgi:superfamily II DNA/RNA helicase